MSNVQNRILIVDDDDEIRELLEFDIAKITGAGYSVLTPVIISNTADYADVVPTDAKKVAALDALITVL